MKQGIIKGAWMRIPALVVGVFLLVAAFGWGLQTFKNDKLNELAPPPGKLVATRFGTMHLSCNGEGSPTLVFSSGLGSAGLQWTLVQTALPKHWRSCVYDRLGLGWSDEAPTGPRLAGEMASELEELLSKAGEKPPYLLIGTSLGGFVMRVFAMRHPDLTVGLLLINGAAEDLNRFLPRNRELQRTQQHLVWLCRLVSPFGVLRLFGPPTEEANYAELPQEQREAAHEIYLRSDQCTTIYQENAGFTQSGEEVRGKSLDDLPLLVVTTLQSKEDFPSWWDIPLEESRQGWLAAQKEHLKLSSRAEQMIADGPYNVPLAMPELVMEAIGRMMAELAPPPLLKRCCE